jgi:RNA polymerase sigma factor (sigma-70 family)
MDSEPPCRHGLPGDNISSIVSLPATAPQDTMDRLTRCFLEIRDELLRFLARRTGRAEAEDVVQEVWLNLRERGDYEAWREPRAVLYRTAANLGTDTYRRDVLTQKLFTGEEGLDDAVSPQPGPESQAESADQLERLLAALEQLPPQSREALLLNRLEGLTHTQIAQRLGISTKTVQRHIERALRLCAQVLE